MRFAFLAFLSIFFLTTIFSGAVFAAIPQTEREVLIAFYHATGGDEWLKSYGWLGSWGSENRSFFETGII